MCCSITATILPQLMQLELAGKWGASRVTAVLTIPGDRADSIVEGAGAAVANHFDRVVLREDQDLRGREPGAITAILRRAIERENPDCEIEEIREEPIAVSHTLET